MSSLSKKMIAKLRSSTGTSSERDGSDSKMRVPSSANTAASSDGKPDRLLHVGEPVAQQRRNELGAQPFGVDRKPHHAGHALARGRLETHLALHVVLAAVDHLGEGDNRHARLHQLAEPRQQLGAEYVVLAEAGFDLAVRLRNRLLVVRQPLVAVRPPLGPDEERGDVRALDERFAHDRIDERQVEWLDARLRQAQKHVEVRAVEVVLDRLGQRVGGVAAQLAQDHGRGLLDIVQGAELEVEQHRHREWRRQWRGRPPGESPRSCTNCHAGLGRVPSLISSS